MQLSVKPVIHPHFVQAGLVFQTLDAEVGNAVILMNGQSPPFSVNLRWDAAVIHGGKRFLLAVR